MDSSSRRGHEAIASVGGIGADSPELRRLVEARSALDHARRHAKWRRKCKNLQAAAHEVQVAALAAHSAGVGWVQIGDVLGIDRAMAPSIVTATEPPPPEQLTTPDAAPTRHRTHDIMAVASRHLTGETQPVFG